MTKTKKIAKKIPFVLLLALVPSFNTWTLETYQSPMVETSLDIALNDSIYKYHALENKVHFFDNLKNKIGK